MYKYLTKFLFLLFMTTSFSVVAKNDVVKVYDKGADGMRRYHAVVCPDGNKIYITQMLNKRGESVSSGDAISLEPLVDEVDEDEDFSETTTKPVRSGNSSGLNSQASASSSGSVKEQTEGLKRKFLKLIGAKNKIEVCIDAQCNLYENVDAAAKAACDIKR